MTFAPVEPDPMLPPVRVNLFSDTQTRPTAGMRDAMLRARWATSRSATIRP